ncbi:hypothetical protein HYR54_07965 [Candidatus Acetothermia bacterium]|nr:hypothetical protein [Candidatus Acetothermia bacterium]
MKSVIQLIWAGAVLASTVIGGLSLGAIAAPGPVEDLRSNITAFQAKLVVFDQGLLDLSQQIRSIVGEILNARDLIDAGQGHLDRLVRGSVEEAIDIKQLTLDDTLTELQGDLENLVLALNALIGQLNGLCPPLSNKINADKCTFVLAKFNNIALYLQDVGNELDVIFATLEDGDAGEDPTNPDTFDDVDDWLEFCLSEQLPNDLQGCSQSLGQGFSLLQEITQEIALLSLKKKYIAKNIVHAQKLLLSTGAPRVRMVSTPMNENASERVTVQIFGLNGQLLYEEQQYSHTLARADKRYALADGVYLSVASTRDSNGRVLQRDVRKLIVRH